jgi:hypothetical protein
VQRYTVKVNGMTTTLRLSDEDATKRGLAPKPEFVQEPVPVPAKAKAPANKSRRPANKAAKREDIAALAFRPKAEA